MHQKKKKKKTKKECDDKSNRQAKRNKGKEFYAKFDANIN